MSGSRNTTTSSTTQKASPYNQQSVDFGLSAARDVYDNRMSSPAFFPGQTYANPAAETEQALSGMADRARAGSPLVQGAQGNLQSVIGGDYLSAGNPYFSQMADRVTQNVLPSITAQWARAGRGVGNDQVVEAASRGLGDAIGQLAYQNYGDERGRQMQAIGMAPTMAAQDYADLDRLGQVGAAREAIAQQGINESMARFQAQQDQGARALAEYQGFTMPTNQAFATQTGSSTQTQQQKPSALQTAVGLGLMAASPFTGGMTAGAGMLGGGLSAAMPWATRGAQTSAVDPALMRAYQLANL